MKFFLVLLGFVIIACESGKIDKYNKNLKCEEHKGVCPVFPKNCEEFHHSKISCSCDDLCEPHQKCCDHPCYSEKICVSAHKKPEKHTRRNPNDFVINTADLPQKNVKFTHHKSDSNPADLLKKTAKQSHHSENSNKNITNPAIFHKHSIEQHKEFKPSPEMKINVIYNIVKKIYVQHMNVYKDKVEVGDKKVETITESTKVETSIDFKPELNSQPTPVLTTPASGLEDDEDSLPENGSGSGPVILVENEKSPEGSTGDLDGSKLELNTPASGLDDDEDNLLGNGSGSGPVIPDKNTESPERSTVGDLDGSGDVEVDTLDLESLGPNKEIMKVLKTTDGKDVIILNDNNNDFDPDITFED